MSATREASAVESLRQGICELLIKNQQLRIAPMEEMGGSFVLAEIING